MMKRNAVITIMCLFAVGVFSQITPYNPGRTIVASGESLDALTDATYKIHFQNAAQIYTIGVGLSDTIELDDTLYVRLYGGIDGGTWYPVGDTIALDSTNYPCADYWTGTNFAWPFAKIEVDRDTSLVDGDFFLILWYK